MALVSTIQPVKKESPTLPTLPTLGFGVMDSISENFFVDSENVIFSRGEGLVKILEVLEV